MTGNVGNFITTTLLTLSCSLILFIAYRHALRPILLKHNIIPLQNLPRTISDTFSSRGHVRLEDGDGGDSRDLEEGFRDDSDNEEDAVGDERIRREPRGTP